MRGPPRLSVTRARARSHVVNRAHLFTQLGFPLVLFVHGNVYDAANVGWRLHTAFHESDHSLTPEFPEQVAMLKGDVLAGPWT